MRSALSVILTVVGLLSQSVAAQQRQARDPAKEALITQQLQAVAPSAVATFQAATHALDQKNYVEAARLFRWVTEAARDFSPAMRRLGLALAESGELSEALAMLERAVAEERSPENLISLARVLAHPRQGVEGSQYQRERALSLAKEASEKQPAADDPGYLVTVAQIALSLQQKPDFQQASDALAQKYPGLMATHYFQGISAALDQNWADAEKEIKKAVELGLPPEVAKGLLDSGLSSRAAVWRWAHYTLYLILAWAGGLVLLYAVGRIMSRMTMQFIETADPNAMVVGRERSLRNVYRTLVNIAALYCNPPRFSPWPRRGFLKLSSLGGEGWCGVQWHQSESRWRWINRRSIS